MNTSATWDQKTFDRTLRDYLHRLPEQKIPQALNKKAFFIALGAYGETEAVNPHKIFWELYRPIVAKRQDGTSGTVPVGFVVAAKRASGQWFNRQLALDQRKRRPDMAREWQKLITKKFTSMIGGRRAAIGFIRVGWLACIKALGSQVRGKDGRSTSGPTPKSRGGMKGRVSPASAGWNPKVTIENSAQAKSDKAMGLIKHGAPALQRAFDKEAADMAAYLEREVLKEENAKFNSEQR